MNTPSKPRCALTGANGYLGGLIARRLQADGWEVVPLTRQPQTGGARFVLGEPIAPETLTGCSALIHCAYDFAPTTWSEIVRINVEGAAQLFAGGRAAGIEHTVAISTISAFTGCKSMYGRAKLLIEAKAKDATIIRPGLIYGASPGAMFGRLVKQVRAARFVPIPGDGRQMMFTVHEEDLLDAIMRGLERTPGAPVTVAHHVPIAFRDIMIAIGARLDRRITTIPTPWQAMWLALRAAELARIPLGLRSDSLISLMHQDPTPLLNAEPELGVQCRAFDLSDVPL